MPHPIPEIKDQNMTRTSCKIKFNLDTFLLLNFFVPLQSSMNSMLEKINDRSNKIETHNERTIVKNEARVKVPMQLVDTARLSLLCATHKEDFLNGFDLNFRDERLPQGSVRSYVHEKLQVIHHQNIQIEDHPTDFVSRLGVILGESKDSRQRLMVQSESRIENNVNKNIELESRLQIIRSRQLMDDWDKLFPGKSGS